VDAERGSDFVLIGLTSMLFVWWRNPDDVRRARHFSQLDLRHLREESRGLRGVAAHGPSGALAAPLRTVGQDLDSAYADSIGIVQLPDAMFVTATSQDGHLRWTYSADELHRLSRHRRQARR
jgi:hypothetical protein